MVGKMNVLFVIGNDVRDIKASKFLTDLSQAKGLDN